MIPPFFPDASDSDFERNIFEQFRDSSDTQGWFVLHSVKIANHRNQIEGEIDFVVVVPGMGVLCLEIKGARSLRHENRLWYYGDEQVGKRIGPFEQANYNRHSLLKYLSRDNKRTSYPVTYAVWFPLLSASQISDPDDQESLERHDWVILDVDAYRQRSPGKHCVRVLEKWRSHIQSQSSGGWLRESHDQPDGAAVNEIVRMLKRDFHADITPATILIEQKQETEYLTKMRESVLGPLRKVSQIVFEGPAGTGKTFIAMALAKRGAEEGRRVLVVCHTNLLARWLECNLRRYKKVNVCTFSQLQFAILGLNPEEGAERLHDKEFWKSLPKGAVAALLTDESLTGRYEEIIVDEGQDLFNEDLIDVFDLVLRGGWKDGRWALCGDWERQKIFSGDSTDNLAFLEAALGHKPFTFFLQDNC